MGLTAGVAEGVTAGVAAGMPTLAPIMFPLGGVNLQAVETRLIQQALERESGNRSRAARLLGLTRDTLLYRLKKYELTEYALQA